MDIQVLKYFLAVCREENITRAAEAMHIAQPSLSNRMKELEAELGLTLFIRGKRKVTLTDDGQLLRGRAIELVELLEKTQRELVSDSGKVAGDLAIGSGETEALGYLVNIMAQLNEIYPDIHYRLFSGDADAIMQRLDTGLLDFGILIDPVDTSKYEKIQLPISDRWGILLPCSDKPAKKTKLKAETLSALPLIVPERQALQREISALLHKDFQSLNIKASYNLASNAALMVKARLGYALILDKLIEKDSELCFRPLSPDAKVTLNIAWKKNRVLSKPSENFLMLLKSKL